MQPFLGSIGARPRPSASNRLVVLLVNVRAPICTCNLFVRPRTVPAMIDLLPMMPVLNLLSPSLSQRSQSQIGPALLALEAELKRASCIQTYSVTTHSPVATRPAPSRHGGPEESGAVRTPLASYLPPSEHADAENHVSLHTRARTTTTTTTTFVWSRHAHRTREPNQRRRIQRARTS